MPIGFPSGAMEAVCEALALGYVTYLICKVADWPLWISCIAIAVFLGRELDSKIKAYNNLVRHWNRKVEEDKERLLEERARRRRQGRQEQPPS
ncbi:hypothetical protein [Streptomyces olivaceoviridis]|uniref:hypothetical protein n=1 Tax=Streptomyces olivaceoviridis TaxID=1921 RepID=UPI0037ABC1B4